MLRPLRPGDIFAVSRLEALCQSAPWPEESFSRLLAQPNMHGLVWEENGRILGFCIYMVVLSDFEILDLVTHPQARRRGIARLLLRAVIEERHGPLQRGYLEVRVSNVGAKALYEGLGFKVFGRRLRYYSDNGEDALMLRWQRGA